MSHPDADQLHRLLAETLPLDERDAVASHVDGCDECLERLDGLQRPRRSDLRRLADLLLSPPDDTPLSPTAPHAPPASDSELPQFPGYEVLAHVGRGGMGEVYRARHRATNRVVALKTLPPGAAQGPERAERLARFRNECEAVGRLQHPGIVAVYDVGERDGVPYFTMEWVDGGSLAEWLGGRPQPERLAALWSAQLAEAVAQIHLRKIVHRDLKPANVLLQGEMNRQGAEDTKEDSKRVGSDTLSPLHSLAFSAPWRFVPKISDFGIAKLLDRPGLLTQPAQRIGTPEYMAPEQAAGDTEHVGPSADVYALGAILYEMLTGRPPFRADEPLETLRQVRDEEPLPPRRLRPRLSRDLETVCLKCLRKEPERRYATAQELADDLRRFLDGEPIRARPVGAWERTVKWARRRPERAALAALGLLLVGALAANYFGQAWAENARRARQLADATDSQLLLVKYAVSQAARKEPLPKLLRDPKGNAAALEGFMADTRDNSVRWFSRPGEEQPIINWFVLNPEGVILADSYPGQRNSVGRNYGFRNYASRLLSPDAPDDRGAVQVSKLYKSEQDDRYKFTVVTRVWDGDDLRGVLAASLAVDARLVALDMRREGEGASVVGPMDDRVRPGNPPSDEPRHVVVLHRDYATPGQPPLPAGHPTILAALDKDPDRNEASVVLGRDGSFAHLARVGDTGFVAVVERPWPAPVGALLRWPVVSLVAVTGAVALLVVIRWRVLRTREVHHD